MRTAALRRACGVALGVRGRRARRRGPREAAGPPGRCAECRRDVDELRAVRDLLGRARSQPAPATDDLSARLVSIAGMAATEPLYTRPFRRPAAAEHAGTAQPAACPANPDDRGRCGRRRHLHCRRHDRLCRRSLRPARGGRRPGRPGAGGVQLQPGTVPAGQRRVGCGDAGRCRPSCRRYSGRPRAAAVPQRQPGRSRSAAAGGGHGAGGGQPARGQLQRTAGRSSRPGTARRCGRRSRSRPGPARASSRGAQPERQAAASTASARRRCRPGSSTTTCSTCLPPTTPSTGSAGATVAGRRATEISAWSLGQRAARWWLDDETGIVLWQELYDRTGAVALSTGFTSVTVSPAAEMMEHLPPRLVPATDHDVALGRRRGLAERARAGPASGTCPGCPWCGCTPTGPPARRRCRRSTATGWPRSA